MAEENNWHKFIVYAEDFHTAASYAGKKEWWLHCWDWEYGPGEPSHVLRAVAE